MTNLGYVSIPLEEFERLHAEIRTLTEQRDGYYSLATTINDGRQVDKAQMHLAYARIRNLQTRASELQNYADRHPCDHMPRCADAQEP